MAALGFKAWNVPSLIPLYGCKYCPPIRFAPSNNSILGLIRLNPSAAAEVPYDELVFLVVITTWISISSPLKIADWGWLDKAALF